MKRPVHMELPDGSWKKNLKTSATDEINQVQQESEDIPHIFHMAPIFSAEQPSY
jgi:hypothetical protein